MQDNSNLKSGSIQRDGSIIIGDEEKELKAAIVKLKTQNEALRNQLRDLSIKLTEALEKVKPKNQKALETAKSPEFREETLQKEIANANQQIAMYKKEISTLRNRIDVDTAEYKIVQLENMLRERDKRIEDLFNEKRNLEKITRDQQRELENHDNEEENQGRIKANAEDVKSLRTRVRDITEKMRHEEKNYKKQQEHITVLEQKYREVCQKLGVQPIDANAISLKTKNATPKGAFKIDDKKDPKLKQKEADLEVEEADGLEPNEENFIKLKKNKKILKQNIISIEKRQKIQAELIKNKLKQSESEKVEMDTKLKETEKEIEDLMQKVSKFKKSARPSTLQPLSISAPTKPEKTLAEKKATSPISTKKKVAPSKPTINKEIIGIVGTSLFDDTDLLKGKIESKITKLIVWSGDEYIYGIQAFYTCSNADISGNPNIKDSMKKIVKLSNSIDINNDDFITNITGKYNNGIVSLRVQTSKGIIKEFGNVKAEGDESEINLKIGEKTSGIFGSFADKKIGSNLTILSSFGLNVVRFDKIDEEF